MNKILTICMVFMAFAIPASAANTISIGDHVLNIGETKKVPVLLNDAANIFAVNITLSYNSNVVSVTPAEAGSFSNYFPVMTDNNTLLIYAFGQLANSSPVGLNGNQTIGYVNLTAKSCNTSALNIKLNELLTAADVDEAANATVNNGSVTVNGCITPTATPTVTATPQPNVTETPQPNVTETPQPNVTVTATPTVTLTATPTATATPPIETRRVIEIIDNMSGVPIINESTINILAEDFINFNAGDRYNITITRVTGGTVEFNTSGTLLGLPKETIKIDWTPQTQGAYILRSDANTTTESKVVQVINQKVISPIPELTTIVLVSAGLLGLIGISRKRK